MILDPHHQAARRVVAALALGTGTALAPSRAAAQPAAAARSIPVRDAQAAGDSALHARIRRIGARTGGRLTIAAVDVERGGGVSVDGDVPVFMSSVVKLPLAVQLLARADRGELRLADSITLTAGDLRPGHSPLAAAHPAGGVTLTVAELLRRAVSESDNTASDALLRYSGGPARVTRELRALGAAGVRVDRGYAEYMRDHAGLGPLPPDLRWTPARTDSLTRAVPPARRAAAARRFLDDDRDRATADALAGLLVRIARGGLLRPDSRALLLRWMTATANPATRLVAGAPAGASVAHKTGTWGGSAGGFAAVNDVGIVTLPDQGGRLAVAVLVRGATAPLAATDSAIADATRAVLAHWGAARTTTAGALPAGGGAAR